ncbi:unnamed protein product [Adineta steineri]|uniref:TLC domain-containing protein n=1 Tax=Adineta steineri TaxID=433720 RepID=A0A813R5T3_9BILA|nr:unnamed protein product [Adineta steineri]
MHTKIYFDESDLFPYEPISSIWMIFYIILTFYFFTICNQKLNGKNKNKKIQWLHQNTLLSFIHACICSALILISIIGAPGIFQDPLSHSNHFNYAILAFSTGYFIYDFVDCLQNSTDSVFPILIHHLIVISFLSHVLYYTRNVGYAIYGLSIEVNSIFLHARRVIRWYPPIFKSAYHNHLLKIFIDIGNYLTFILFRFGIVYVGLRALYIQGERVHPVIKAYTVMIVSSMGFLNVILLYRLLKSQFKKKSKNKREKQSEDKILMTDNHILLPS